MSNGLRTYVISVNSYEEAKQLLKYIRNKKGLIHQVVIIASLPQTKRLKIDHLKVNDGVVLGQKALVVLVR